MRVVADTNVIISMLLWGQSLERLFVLVNTRKITLCFSPHTIDELLRVVNYPHIRKQAEKYEVPIELLLDKLFAASLIAYPTQRISAVKEDKSDNRFLETAVASRAEYIITGDRHLLRLGSYKNISILKPKRFLEMFGG